MLSRGYSSVLLPPVMNIWNACWPGRTMALWRGLSFSWWALLTRTFAVSLTMSSDGGPVMIEFLAETR